MHPYISVFQVAEQHPPIRGFSAWLVFGRHSSRVRVFTDFSLHPHQKHSRLRPLRLQLLFRLVREDLSGGETPQAAGQPVKLKKSINIKFSIFGIKLHILLFF